MFPVFVLEGPDGVGKTTLAEALCKELGAKYLHLTYRWPKKMFMYHQAAMEYVLRVAQTRPVVLDRWWPSEIAYANAYRNGSKWPMAYRMFEKVALRHNFSYVMCLPSNKKKYLEHYNLLKGRREEMYDEGMERVYDEFNFMWGNYFNHRANCFRYDFFLQGNDIESVVQSLLEMNADNLFSQNTGQSIIHCNPKFLNATGDYGQAKYLLIGDQSKPKTRRKTWPFFEYGNSSLWLAEALHILNVPEYELMFMNAVYPENQDYTNWLAHFFGSLHVVAMGDTAKQFCDRLNIQAVKIRHPQYYRRFYPNKGIDELKEALEHGH